MSATYDDVANIVVAADGDVWVGPELTAAPDFGEAPDDADWTAVGYATEDGVQIGYDRSVQGVPAWQALGSLRNLTTDAPMTVTFTCIEFKPDVVMLAFRGGAVVVAAGSGKYTPPDADAGDVRAVFVRGIDGDTTVDVWFPRVEMQSSHQMNLQRIQETRVPVELGVLFNSPRFTIESDHPAWLAA